MQFRITVGSLAVLPLALVLADCRDATQLSLEITTDFDCAGSNGGSGAAGLETSIRVGHSGSLETKSPATVTTQCKDRRVGALVIVPSGAKDDDIAVEVVSGIGKSVEECTPDAATNCIFARRSLRYQPHEDIQLPIVMRASCISKVCDPSSTCIQGGCVPAACPPGQPCDEGTLTPDGGAPPIADAQADATSARDAPASNDGAAPVDARSDGLDPSDGAVTGIKLLVSGGSHNCALYMSGAVRCWGSNTSGQLGDGTGASSSTPVSAKEADGSAVVANDIAAGGAHTCIDRGGAIDCYGANYAGELELGSGQSYFQPHKPPYSGSPTQAFLGQQSSCFRNAAGATTCLGTSAITYNPNPLTGAALGECHGCYATSAGNVSCWGDQSAARLGNGNLSTLVPAYGTNITPGTEVAVAAHHSCAINAGVVKCWGSWMDVPCGTSYDASPTSVGTMFSSTPSPAGGVPMPGGLHVVHIALGRSHACALLSDTSVACWGEDNGRGQLGTGDTAAQVTPVLVTLPGGAHLMGAKAISAGSRHSCALLNDGQVMCWGDNSFGQLGLATGIDTVPHPNPSFVGGL